MDKRKSTKLEMYLRLRQVLQENSSAWGGLQAFNEAYETFDEKIGVLSGLSHEQHEKTLGISTKKSVRKTELIDKSMAIAAALKALASKNDLKDLEVAMKISSSLLKRSNNSEFLHLIDRIIEKCQAHISELGSFGVDESKLNLLQELRNDYSVTTLSPRKAINDRKTITLQIDKVCSELDKIVSGQMDELVLILKELDPLFYDKYHSSRIVIDTKSTKAKSSENDSEATDEGSN